MKPDLSVGKRWCLAIRQLELDGNQSENRKRWSWRRSFVFPGCYARSEKLNKTCFRCKLKADKEISRTKIFLRFFVYNYQIDQPEFGLRMEFLVKGIEDTNVKAYFDFMVDAAVIFGANRSVAERELMDSLNFETELAKVIQNLI